MSTPEIGFVGLGRMGFPMARNLARAGYRVHVHDVAPDAMRRATEVDGLTSHRSPRDVAAAATVVFTALPNDVIVRETYLGPAGLLAGGPAGLVTCDCSTVSPGRHARHPPGGPRARDRITCDTPMLGSSPQAESGEIFFIVGGDADTDAGDPAPPRRDGAPHDARRAARAPATGSSSCTTRSAR